MYKRVLGLVVFLGVLFLAAGVSAQSSAISAISSINTQDFPEVSFYLDVHNAQGIFVHGLETGDVRLQEDGRQVPISEFAELRPGVQVVYALNPGPSFAIRNSQGESRMDFVLAALGAWAQSRTGSTLDDLSLVTTGSTDQSHFSNPDELLSNLEALDLDLDALEPSLDLLSQAIDVAADATPRAGMERAILLITAPMNGDLAFGAQDIITRARESGVRIYIWLVASRDLFEAPESDTLRQISAETGGAFYAFAGDEPLPAIESYLVSLRDIYLVRYESGMRMGGAHELSIEFVNGADLQPATQTFDFEILPPNPAFVDPDLEISRAAPEGQNGIIPEEPQPDQLQPAVQDLQILFDFPDGRVRPLVQTRLFVDGELVDENLEAPFDRFQWDLRGYLENGQHLLRVEALDQFGLRGSSIELPVELVVDSPDVPVWANVLQSGPLLILPAAIFLAALVVLVLILLGRIRPHILRVPAGLRQVGRRAIRLRRSGVEGEKAPRRSGGRLTGWVNRLNWPQRRMSPRALAYLEPIVETEASKPLPISIVADEMTFGSDQDLATVVIHDDSVQGLHARLQHTGDGGYLLCDQDSIAGTWVNYTPVPGEGMQIHHGDLIHLGRAGYRFKQRDAKNGRVLVIRPGET